MWPKEYTELERIDASLQCGICYEYMDTSVITSCSHNYCSLCIRKYMLYKAECPICSEEILDKDLRRNKLLDEIIIQYLNFKKKHEEKFHREKLLTAKNKNSEAACSANDLECKKENDVPHVSHEVFDSPMAGNTAPFERKTYQQDVSTPSTSADPRIPLIFTPKSRKGFRNEKGRQVVSCPVCKVEVLQNNINKHLDDCLKRENTKNQHKESQPKRKPLPKFVLCLMKDTLLRKTLRELGLSFQGDRRTLKNRLQRYTVFYNAECDKTYPRPVSELIKQFEEEENLEKKLQKPSNSIFVNVTGNTSHKIIEQKRKEYLDTNKDSFEQLIARVKHENDSQKISVRCNINEENFDISCNDRVAENSSITKNDQRTDFLPLNSTNYIGDSNSNTTYPLQSYSRENPMDFLTIELNSSSNDSTDQCAFNRDTSNRLNETSPDLFKSIIETENIKIKKLSSENISIHEEINSDNRSNQYDVLQNEMDIDTTKSIPELINRKTENKEQIRLPNENRSGTKYNSDECVVPSEPTDRRQIELRNENVDSFVEDIEYSVKDGGSIGVQDGYGRSKHEQLNRAMKEYDPGTKSVKDNVKALTKGLTIWDLRKRERQMALSDEEKIGERAMNSKKLFRLDFSEAKRYNNENFSETVRGEEKSQSEKEQSQVIRTNNIRNSTRKSIRLKNKTSNDIREN